MNPVEADTAAPAAAVKRGPSRRAAWIRYRTELRHERTGKLLERKDSETKQDFGHDTLGQNPMFELLTIYETRGSESDFDRNRYTFGASTSWTSHTSGATPSYSLNIYSLAIINALRTVVDYYPGQDLSGDVVGVAWPYAILVHHYDQLRDFKTSCQDKQPEELCVRERDAPEHIDHLLRFLDDTVMEKVRAEQERMKRGFYTYENLWIYYKPGRTVAQYTTEGSWHPFVVSEIEGGVFENPPSNWIVKGWTLGFNGNCVGRCRYYLLESKFDGEVDYRRGSFFFDDRPDFDAGHLEERITYGRLWYKLLQKQCRYHKGRSVNFPYNEACGFGHIVPPPPLPLLC